MRNIILYFPYFNVGGVSLLFKRISSYLLPTSNVYLVDFRNGFMGMDTPAGVKFVDYEKVEQYPGDSILILQSLAPWNIRDVSKFPGDTRVLFWNLHPLNFYPYIFSIHSPSQLKSNVGKILNTLSFFRKKKLERLVKYLSEADSLVFMDGENYSSTSNYFPNLDIRKKILPIMTGDAGQIDDFNGGATLRCCWIGRLVDFKINILIHLIMRLDVAVDRVGPIALTIVGDGEPADVDILRQEVAQFHNIKINFIANIKPNQLGDFIEKDIDVLFAMGTSALEGASRHRPTFILDYSYQIIKGTYRFKYIFESSECNLAEKIDPALHYEVYSTLEDKLIEIKSNYRVIGSKCFEYWQLNFSPEITVKKFINYVDNAGATIGQMRAQGFFEADPLSILIKKTLRLFKKENPTHGFLEN